MAGRPLSGDAVEAAFEDVLDDRPLFTDVCSPELAALIRDESLSLSCDPLAFHALYMGAVSFVAGVGTCVSGGHQTESSWEVATILWPFIAAFPGRMKTTIVKRIKDLFRAFLELIGTGRGDGTYVDLYLDNCATPEMRFKFLVKSKGAGFRLEDEVGHFLDQMDRYASGACVRGSSFCGCIVCDLSDSLLASHAGGVPGAATTQLLSFKGGMGFDRRVKSDDEDAQTGVEKTALVLGGGIQPDVRARAHVLTITRSVLRRVGLFALRMPTGVI